MSEQEFIGLVIDDKYRLDQKIGEGGMGAVYRGTQIMVDRHVAIKLLHSGLNEHERIKQRFEVEAKAIGRMHHPNCITLFDFGFSSEINAFYMVMEFLDGTPMHKRVYEGVTIGEAIAITRQIALALDHAHYQGILHRDLKPENVMLTPMTDGTELVKVLDFGIARIFSGDDTSEQTPEQQNRLTKAGEVFGTPAYISPEQARGERELSPASDLYSLGVILFEMITGDLPFWGETAMETIMKHVTQPVPAINRLDIPQELKQLTYALLDKVPTKRPQSGKALAEHLDAIAQIRAQGNHAASSASMNLRVHSSDSSMEIHKTLPDVPDASDYEEWAEAGATVVRHIDDLSQDMPRSAVRAVASARPHAPAPNFGATKLPAHSVAPVMPHQTIQTRSSHAPSLDTLESAYADLETKSSTKLLPLVALALICLLGAGVWLFLTFKQESDIKTTESGSEQARTFAPSSSSTDTSAIEPPSETTRAEPPVKLDELSEGRVKRPEIHPPPDQADDKEPLKPTKKKNKTRPKRKKQPSTKRPSEKNKKKKKPEKKRRGTRALGIDEVNENTPKDKSLSL